jgi:hypothetical protein
MDLFETHILSANTYSDVETGKGRLMCAMRAIQYELDEQTRKLLNPLLSDDMMKDIESNILRMIDRIENYRMALRMTMRYLYEYERCPCLEHYYLTAVAARRVAREAAAVAERTIWAAERMAAEQRVAFVAPDN